MPLHWQDAELEKNVEVSASGRPLYSSESSLNGMALWPYCSINKSQTLHALFNPCFDDHLHAPARSPNLCRRHTHSCLQTAALQSVCVLGQCSTDTRQSLHIFGLDAHSIAGAGTHLETRSREPQQRACASAWHTGQCALSPGTTTCC